MNFLVVWPFVKVKQKPKRKNRIIVQSCGGRTLCQKRLNSKFNWVHKSPLKCNFGKIKLFAEHVKFHNENVIMKIHRNNLQVIGRSFDLNTRPLNPLRIQNIHFWLKMNKFDLNDLTKLSKRAYFEISHFESSKYVVT